MELQETKPRELSLADVAARLEEAGMYGVAHELRLLIPKYVRVEDKAERFGPRIRRHIITPER